MRFSWREEKQAGDLLFRDQEQVMKERWFAGLKFKPYLLFFWPISSLCEWFW